jgi:hypothetical protein
VEWARAGLRAGAFRVFVHVRERVYLILPSRDVEITGKIIGVWRRPDGEWDVRFFENAEEARLFRARANMLSAPGTVKGENENQMNT